MPILRPPRYAPPEIIFLYHITSKSNLPSILSEGGIWCSNELERRGVSRISAAHGHIQERRAKTKVPCGPCETLADYVPWSFAHNQPMLCALAHHKIDGQKVKQADMVHLVTSLKRVKNAELDWVFTDGHPVVKPSGFFTDEADFNRVDWPLMKEQWWSNTDDDGGRTRRRQAELLIHHFVPWEVIRWIATKTEETAEYVQSLLPESEHSTKVRVKPDWYFLNR